MVEREVVLRTARLLVTTWDASDLDDLHRMHSDPATMRFIGGRPETRAESEARLARYLDEQSTRGWTKWRVVTTDGRFVGRAGFGAYDDDRDLGYTLARAWWGKGLATEVALALVDWHREHPAPCASDPARSMDLWGFADIDNLASLRVLAKAGLRFVETRQAFGTTCVFLRLDVPPRSPVPPASLPA
ncbi:MAG: GNAT family N-acetyltransferase [Candidatus Nanopelagicales bacterium]